ncbi:MAG: hypothetical protein RTU92_02805, partial [Candidatus Thorarchaeota archaeon]
MVIPDSSQEEVQQGDTSPSKRLSQLIERKTPDSIKRLWRRVTYTQDFPVTDKTSIELGMQLFITGTIYYIETAVSIFLVNSILTLGFDIVVVTLLLLNFTFVAILLGLLNLRLANRFWSLKQAGSFSHVLIHGLSLMSIFVGLFVFHQYTDVLLTSPDRVFSLIIIVFRFAIFS